METVIVIDVLAGHDRVRSRHRIERSGPTASCTIGRGAAADVVLDDPHMAAVHARVSVDAAGTATITDLDSVNGIEIGGRRLHGALDAHLTDGVFRIGRTRLRLRTAHEVIPAEVSYQGVSPKEARARGFRWLAIGVVVSAASMIFSTWTTTIQPRELSTKLLALLLGLLVIGGVWITLWALVSRIAFGESRWLRHSAIFVCAIATLSLAPLVLDTVSGALGIYLPAPADMFLAGVFVATVLAVHLMNASAMRPRFAIAIGILIPAMALGLTQWTESRGQNRSAAYIPDRNRIVPPWLMVRRGEPLQEFVVRFDALKGQADARRAFVEAEDPSPDEDSSDD